MAKEQIYEANLKFTGVSDFGTALEDILGGKVAPPPQGARVDVSFAGSLTGKVSGQMTGVDYINIRADGRFELNIRGTITTDDGARLAFEAYGVVVPQPGSPVVTLTEGVKLTTSFEKYAWVNALHLVGEGTVDPSTGTIHVKVYR